MASCIPLLLLTQPPCLMCTLLLTPQQAKGHTASFMQGTDNLEESSCDDNNIIVYGKFLTDRVLAICFK